MNPFQTKQTIAVALSGFAAQLLPAGWFQPRPLDLNQVQGIAMMTVAAHLLPLDRRGRGMSLGWLRNHGLTNATVGLLRPARPKKPNGRRGGPRHRQW